MPHATIFEERWENAIGARLCEFTRFEPKLQKVGPFSLHVWPMNLVKSMYTAIRVRYTEREHLGDHDSNLQYLTAI